MRTEEVEERREKKEKRSRNKMNKKKLFFFSSILILCNIFSFVQQVNCVTSNNSGSFRTQAIVAKAHRSISQF